MLAQQITDGMSALAWRGIEHSPPVVLRACDWVRSAIDPLRQRHLPLIEFRAVDRREGKPVAVLGGPSAERLAERLFDHSTRRQTESDIPAGRLPARLPSLADDYEIVIARAARSVSRRATGDNVLVVPSLIRLSIDTPLSAGSAAYVRNAQRGNLRRIRDAGFSFEISSDLADFDNFHNDYYLAYQRRRFGELSDGASMRRLRYLFRRGGRIFWIIRGGQRVSGSLMFVRDRTLHTTVIGVLNGNFDHVRSGAFAANYYFLTRWAAENGCDQIDLGLTPPCLTDGLTISKRRWGGAISPPGCERFDYILCWDSCTPRIRQFLNETPLVFRDSDYYSGLTALRAGQPATRGMIQKVVDQCWAPGLRRLVVIADDADSSVFEASKQSSGTQVWLAAPDAPGLAIAGARPTAIVPARIAGQTS